MWNFITSSVYGDDGKLVLGQVEQGMPLQTMKELLADSVDLYQKYNLRGISVVHSRTDIEIKKHMSELAGNNKSHLKALLNEIVDDERRKYQTDYSSMKVAELKKLYKERGHSAAECNKLKKGELIEILENLKSESDEPTPVRKPTPVKKPQKKQKVKKKSAPKKKAVRNCKDFTVKDLKKLQEYKDLKQKGKSQLSKDDLCKALGFNV